MMTSLNADEIRRFVNDPVRKRLAAIDVFSEAIELDPAWAEAWNKRATVFYMVGEFQKSQDDIDKVLELEKRHFGALAGQGMVNIKLKNKSKKIQNRIEYCMFYQDFL